MQAIKPAEKWAVVLDGEQNQALAFVRDLSAAGYNVAVVHSLRFAKAAWSRFAAKAVRIREDSSNETLIDAIATLVRANGSSPTPILPMTERSTLAIAERRQYLEAMGATFALPPVATLRSAFDKIYTRRLAIEVGVAVPEETVLSAARLKEELSTLTFPVVLKPFSSSLPQSGLTARPRRPSYAGSLEEAQEQLRAPLAEGYRMLAQSFIDGEGVGYFALFCEGEPVAEFAHRRLRDIHPTGSGSSYRESLPLDEALRNAGRSILQKLNWHGLAMVEFKRDTHGRLFFIEVNGRPWNSMALPVSCGVHFPQLCADLASGKRPLPAVETIEYSLRRTRWILGDFRHVYEVLKGKPSGFPGKFPSRLATLGGILTGIGSDSFDCLSVEDPLPELMDWISLAERFFAMKFGYSL